MKLQLKNTEFTNKLTNTFSKVGLKLRKHSPEILVVTGVVGAVASAVVACKATTKLEGILAETKERAQQIHEYTESDKRKEDYTDEVAKKDLALVYVQGGIKVAKLYAPAVALGALSITSILVSHKILSGRNMALAAAYTAVDKGFKEYRNRVIDRFGEEVDRQLKYNIQPKEIETTVKNEETGEETTEVAVVDAPDSNLGYSPYAVLFDCGNPNWVKNAEMNFFWLRSQQNYANDVLRIKGHVFLNDIYERLGMPKTQMGQIVGWVYDENNPDFQNYVDFGIYEMTNERVRAFIEGRERSIVLDFNVDGDIWSLMDTKEHYAKFEK